MSELLERALKAIRAKQPEAASKGFKLLGVVGSVARGEDGPGSDVDIAYHVTGTEASLLDLGGLYADLEDEIGRTIGLIDITMAKPHWRPRLDRDLVTA